MQTSIPILYPIIGQFFFFFQAEDGIRDHCVTGVQTCALPIFGNIIWNPPGSGVRLSILKWTSNVVATSASLTGIGIAGGFQTTSPTGLGAATATGNTFVNGIVRIAGLAQAYGSATLLTAPVIIAVLHHNTAAINTVGAEQMSGDLEGSIVVDQGGFVTLCALGAAAASSGHTSSIMWEEVPL